MRKIAEVQIGSNLPNDYHHSGSPTVFMMHTPKDVYYGVCNVCGTHFTCNYLADMHVVSCPSCGKIHRQNEIMYFHNLEKMPQGKMPYNLIMKVIDFKKKVELRLTYRTAVLDADKQYASLKETKEIFQFLCNEHRVLWKYEEEQEEPIEREIGYIKDYPVLYEKTALSFFAFNHKTKHGSFTKLLKKLRDAVNKHMQSIGYSKKSLYVNNDLERKLYASILAIAHKIRFWDAELPYQFYGLSYTQWETMVLKEKYLPDEWEKSIENLMKHGITYQNAVTSVLSIPNTPIVRKNLQYKNLFILQQAFSMPYSVGNNILPYYMSMNVLKKDYTTRCCENHQQILDITEFFHNFYDKYKHVLHVKNVIHHWYDEYKDILQLYRQADRITKEKFHKEFIPLKQVHDWLSVAIIEQDNRECIFDIQNNTKKKLLKIINKYTFKCIERKSELLYIAKKLHNCSAGYADLVGNRMQLVVVKENTTIKALLEIRENQIVQAKLVNNRQVSESIEINRACCAYSSETHLPCVTKDISA